MTKLKINDIEWLTPQGIEHRFEKIIYKERLGNQDFAEDSYIWSIGEIVYEQLNKFRKVYPISDRMFFGINMTIDPDLCNSYTVTLRERTPSEMMLAKVKVQQYCTPDANMNVAALLPAPTIYDAIKPIKKVIFNDPATIVLWCDGSKTVVKAENEPFDPEKGLAMAIAKRSFGNKGKYYDIFREWLPK